MICKLEVIAKLVCLENDDINTTWISFPLKYVRLW